MTDDGGGGDDDDGDDGYCCYWDWPGLLSSFDQNRFFVDFYIHIKKQIFSGTEIFIRKIYLEK